jgi:hypothetical protein
MRRILISAPNSTASNLEEKLRHKFDVKVEFISPHDICEIKGRIRREWVTICSFAHDESLKDVLTMFEVNYELKTKQATKK